MIIIAALFLLGFALGWVCMWVYYKRVDKPATKAIKTEKRKLLKNIITHEGSWAIMQGYLVRNITLSLAHMKLVFIPALLGCAPLIMLLITADYFQPPISLEAEIAFWGAFCVACLLMVFRENKRA